MEFKIEEIEKLADSLMSGAEKDIPKDVELIDESDFLKFFASMGVYLIAISKSLESINSRLMTIEMALTNEKEIGRA